MEGKGWTAAGELIQGDQVRLYSDQVLEINKVILERLPDTIKVYNFEVEGWHTYFVSESNVLVHNSCSIKPLGKGSTGRTVANNLAEKLAMEEVMSNPLEGATKVVIKMNDSRWLDSDGWVKMQRVITTSKGKITIHFNYNTKTGDFDDFKFK